MAVVQHAPRAQTLLRLQMAQPVSYRCYAFAAQHSQRSVAATLRLPSQSVFSGSHALGAQRSHYSVDANPLPIWPPSLAATSKARQQHRCHMNWRNTGCRVGVFWSVSGCAPCPVTDPMKDLHLYSWGAYLPSRLAAPCAARSPADARGTAGTPGCLAPCPAPVPPAPLPPPRPHSPTARKPRKP